MMSTATLIHCSSTPLTAITEPPPPPAEDVPSEPPTKPAKEEDEPVPSPSVN